MAKLDINQIMEEFYQVDLDLATKRTEFVTIEYEYTSEYNKRLLNSGMGTMALKEAEVMEGLKTDGLWLKYKEAEVETRVLYSRWQTLKQIISALISLRYE